MASSHGSCFNLNELLILWIVPSFLSIAAREIISKLFQIISTFCLKLLPTTSHCNQNKIQINFHGLEGYIFCSILVFLHSPHQLMFPPQRSFCPFASLCSHLKHQNTFLHNSGICHHAGQVNCLNLKEAFSKYPIQSCPIFLPPTALFYFLPRTQCY